MTCKQQLRTHAQAARDALSAEVREQRSADVMRHATLFASRLSGIIGLYMPHKSEVNPLAITAQPHLSFALPVIDDAGNMAFHAWGATTILKKNRFGIDEPTASPAVIPDTIFTPLLAFDRTGTRLGYGKGYYDRYFTNEGKHALRIGLAFSMQLLRTLPRDAHDIALHATITERGIMRHKVRN
jgi:5-formyltetrahydrofolate cyclo-ligase